MEETEKPTLPLNPIEHFDGRLGLRFCVNVASLMHLLWLCIWTVRRFSSLAFCSAIYFVLGLPTATAICFRFQLVGNLV